MKPQLLDMANTPTDEFDLQNCRAKYRNPEVADCLSPAEVFIFCPYVLFFGNGRFCRHPRKNEISERTEILLQQTKGFKQNDS